MALGASLPGGVRAVAEPPQAQFSCRAAALEAGATQTAVVVANNAGSPCSDAQASTTEPLSGLVVLRGGAASTHLPAASGGSAYREGDQATATVGVEGVDIPALGLSIQGIRSEASATCKGGQAVLAGRSTVGEVRVAGVLVPLLPGPVDVPLGVATLHLNRTIYDGGRILQRGVWVQSPLGDVIVGEASAGSTGPVCGSAVITIVSGTPASSGQTFAFTGDLGSFVLPEPGTSPPSDRHVVAVAPGRYAVTQLPSPAQAALQPLASLTCSQGSDASVDLARRTITIAVKPGDAVTCTFTNQPPPVGLAPGPPQTVHIVPSFNPPALHVTPRPIAAPATTPRPPAAPATTPTAAPGPGAAASPGVAASPAPTGEALPATSGVSSAGGFPRIWLLLALGILVLILLLLLLLWRRRAEDKRQPSP